MRARIVRGNEEPTTGKGYINPKELTPETYKVYCEMYLGQKIYDVIKPSVSNVSFRMVTRVIDCVNYSLYNNLHLETNKVLLLNKLYTLFLQNMNIELPKDFLYNLTDHLAEYARIMNSQG